MIFSYVLSALLILIALIINRSLDSFSVMEIKPDVLFIIVVYLAYSFGSFYGQTAGFIGGLFLDSNSNGPLGLLTFPLVALGFLVGMFGRSVIRNNFLSVSLLLFVASLIKGIITLCLCAIFSEARLSLVLKIILPEAVYNALLAPVLFFLFDKLYAKELERERY